MRTGGMVRIGFAAAMAVGIRIMAVRVVVSVPAVVDMLVCVIGLGDHRMFGFVQFTHCPQGGLDDNAKRQDHQQSGAQ